MGQQRAQLNDGRSESRKLWAELKGGRQHGPQFRVFGSEFANSLRLFVVLGFLIVSSFSAIAADAARVQTIQLTKGWNAVFLEVEPIDSLPSAVFAGAPVDAVAADYERTSTAQFVSNPEVNMFRQAGWGVWYSEDRQESFLSNLHGIHGQRGYLIHSKADFTWNIKGVVIMPDVKWNQQSFNLVGFGLDEVGAPTFQQFFQGSTQQDQNKIYRLVEGVWKRVANPAAESMRSGEAFWIYCDGPSKYLGPMSVEVPKRAGLLLRTGAESVTLRNQTGFPVTPTIEHVVSDGESPVPMSFVIRVLGDPDSPVRFVSAPKPAGEWMQAMPPIESGASRAVPFEARSEDLVAPTHASLLKISTDLGTVTWVPVYGVTEDSTNE